MKIIIANSSPDPIYEQITKQVKAQVISGELSEGEPLPSIRRLAKELHISVITTRRAYEDLEREGYIDTVTGKGSFVAIQNKEFLREKKIKKWRIYYLIYDKYLVLYFINVSDKKLQQSTIDKIKSELDLLKEYIESKYK